MKLRISKNYKGGSRRRRRRRRGGETNCVKRNF